jgi:hypothetical protein
MSVVSGSSHKGKLPPVREFLRLDAASTVLSSTGLENDGSLLVRVYETAGKKDAVTLVMSQEIKAAELVDLDGKLVTRLEPKGTTASFEIPAWKIQAVRIKVNP